MRRILKLQNCETVGRAASYSNMYMHTDKPTNELRIVGGFGLGSVFGLIGMHILILIAMT